MKKLKLKNIIRELVKEHTTRIPHGPHPHTYSVTTLMTSFYSSLGISPSSPTCTPSNQHPTWRSWLNNLFTNPIGAAGGNPFTSGAQGQPCFYINQQIDNLQTQIAAAIAAGTNPNHSSIRRKQCRLEIYQNLLPWAQSFYGC